LRDDLRGLLSAFALVSHTQDVVGCAREHARSSENAGFFIAL
jgi:hypothetical protein